MKKIIFSLIFLCCCVSSAMAMSNPLNSLVHPAVVGSGSCAAANPSASNFCTYPSTDPGTFINASVCVCKAAGRGGLCTPGYIHYVMKPMNIGILDGGCDQEAQKGILPAGETLAICKQQIQDYFNQCLKTAVK